MCDLISEWKERKKKELDDANSGETSGLLLLQVLVSYLQLKKTNTRHKAFIVLLFFIYN